MSTTHAEIPRWLDLVVLPVFNLVLALLVAGVVVLVAGLDPAQVVTLLIKGAFGSQTGLSYTLYYATTFVFTGLAVAVAFHAGLLNIGG
jgi:simple sugar transport system permease protein